MPSKRSYYLVFSLIFSILLQPGMQSLLTAEEIKSAGSPDDTGYVRIITPHKGLQVFLDGDFRGFTPLDVLALTPGLHTLTLNHPTRFSWLDAGWESQVSVTAGDTIVIRPKFKFSYSIRTEPYGAGIYRDGVAIGTTPKFVRVEEGETSRISLIKEGYRDTTFVIDATSPFSYNVVLKRNLYEQDFSQSVVAKDGSRSKVYLYSAIGLSVAAGALALYFRHKGNTTYDKYLVAEEPERSRLLNETERYDKYAAVSFGTFQLGFVFSFYLLLTQNR